ncbi:MAG: 2-dehydropantoate 2-reductase [Betaproteobacteria bacterium]
MNKVCIVGAGAIGGFIGTRLAAAGQVEVSAIAIGDTLTALKEHGWRLQMADGMVRAPAKVSDKASDLGPQDLVIIAVKGPVLAQVAPAIQPLLGPETVVLPTMNGVPWWFVESVPSLRGTNLRALDSQGVIARHIGFDRVVGAVVHASASSPERGLVMHQMGRGLIVGEPGGGHSARAARIAEILQQAGFDATHSERIRHDIWFKLWGNLTMNPVSAVTGATIDRVLADPLVRAFCSAAMREAAEVGERIGCPISQSPDDRHGLTAKLGAFKTSMLQDAMAGRPIELDAIVGAVQELGDRLGLKTPNIDALLGVSRLFARVHGLYPEEVAL